MDRSVNLLRAFAHLDLRAEEHVEAQAELELATGQCLTICAGGPAAQAGPAGGPFNDYEVVVDHDPPRFWRRYADSNQLIYSHVPKMLIAHHVIRSGGAKSLSAGIRRMPPDKPLVVVVRVPPTSTASFFRAIKGVEGAHLSIEEGSHPSLG